MADFMQMSLQDVRRGPTRQQIFSHAGGAAQEEKRREREATKAQVAADREARNAAEEEAASASEPDEPQPAAAPCTLRNSFINIMSYCRLASSCLLGHDEGERPHPRMPGRDRLWPVLPTWCVCASLAPALAARRAPRSARSRRCTTGMKTLALA